MSVRKLADEMSTEETINIQNFGFRTLSKASNMDGKMKLKCILRKFV
jgi:hypothetical protein